jgi:hypothetical protein
VRYYQHLNIVEHNDDRLQLLSEDDSQYFSMSLAQEGDKVAIDVSIGAMEMALRLRKEELLRTLKSLTYVPGLTTTRQVGTSQAFMGLGLDSENQLILRATLLVDAGGKLTVNLRLGNDIRQQLTTWLEK